MANLLEHETVLDWDRLLYILMSAVPQIESQERVRQFIQGWQSLVQPPTPLQMSELIRTAAYSIKKEKEKQSIKLIWTGPQVSGNNLRRTDQPLLELINAAQYKITLVSFAVYKVQNIMTALEKAANRGVEIHIILESPDSGEGKITFDTISALGASLQARARIFIWPMAKRPKAPSGQIGALHVKVAVTDGKRLYISSANLTESAMKLNIEMGVLMENGEFAYTVEQLFGQFISAGTLSETARNLG